MLGANPRAAAHVGLDPKRVIVTSFLYSGALIGVAAAIEILGIWGYMRADCNPAYGDAVIPFVFLARLNALAVIPFIVFYSVLSIGGDYAAQNAGLPVDFLLVIVGLTLLFMVFIEYLGRNREMGRSYLTPGLRAGLALPEGRSDRAARRLDLHPDVPDVARRRGLLAGVPLHVHGARRADLGGRRRAQHRPRGDDAEGAYAGFVGAYYGDHDWLGYLDGDRAAACSCR